MAAGDAERRYVVGSGWQTVAVSASGVVTAADVDSDGAANGEVLTADGGGGATWEVGGGGSLPAWWTVDSTPGSELVDFAGFVSGHVADADLIALFSDDASGGATTIRRYGLEIGAEPGTGSGPALAISSSILIAEGENLIELENVDDTVFIVGPTGAVTISPSDASAPLTLTGLPAADPSVPGQLYHTAGAVMISL